ncbi:MAG: hypothetical protein ACR2FS_00565 [Phormidesmis sp.]
MASHFLHQVGRLKKDWAFWLPNLLAAASFGILGIFGIIYRGVGGRVIITLFEESFAQKRPYQGVLTEASEILWSLAAGILWFTFSYLKAKHPSAAQSATQYVQKSMLFLCLLVTMFLLDDNFRMTLMLSFYFKIPKVLIYGVYSICLTAYVLPFKKFILKTPYLLLVISICLLSISSLTDVIHPQGQGLPVMLEDGTKFIGLLNFLIYCWKVSLLLIRDRQSALLEMASDRRVQTRQ